MPDETVFAVVHSCGHSRNHDLSANPIAERAGFARLLAWTLCDNCSRPAADNTALTRHSPKVDEPADRPLTAGR